MPVGAVAMLAAGAAGCGSDDFENDPRPATPVEVTARVDEREVAVQPSQVGAGLVTVTISNQSRDPVILTLDGPTVAAADQIPPGGVGNMKADLDEGEYEVTAGEASDAREGQLAVGPDRPTSQNELLKP
ncbi:MAG: hypothetical protein ACRDK9_04490 [Solirubrobacterales bacterium]